MTRRTKVRERIVIYLGTYGNLLYSSDVNLEYNIKIIIYLDGSVRVHTSRLVSADVQSLKMLTMLELVNYVFVVQQQSSIITAIV